MVVKVSMLEKMARAAEAAAEYDGEDRHSDCPGSDRVSNWPEVMRAALQAIREPSAAMLDAGYGDTKGDPDQTGRPDNPLPDDAWPRMIDAILNEAAPQHPAPQPPPDPTR